MMYASVNEFKTIGVSEQVYSDYTDSEIENFLTDASDYINGFVRITYEDVSDFTPLRRICISIAAYNLLVHRGFDIDNTMDQIIKANRDDAIANLILIQKQNIKLNQKINSYARPMVV